MRSKAEAASVTGTVVNKIHSKACFRLLVSQHRTHHPDMGACWRSCPLPGGHKVTSLQATCKRTVRGGCAARPRRSMVVSVWAGSRRAQSSNNFVFLPLPAKTTRFWPTRHKQCQPWARARRAKENTSLARSLTLTQHCSGAAGPMCFSGEAAQLDRSVRLISEAVPLRYPILPVGEGLHGGFLRVDGLQL